MCKDRFDLLPVLLVPIKYVSFHHFTFIDIIYVLVHLQDFNLKEYNWCQMYSN